MTRKKYYEFLKIFNIRGGLIYLVEYCGTGFMKSNFPRYLESKNILLIGAAAIPKNIWYYCVPGKCPVARI